MMNMSFYSRLFLYSFVLFYVFSPIRATNEIIDDKESHYDRVFVEEKGKPCVCMNWRHCKGTIDSDVACPQSYVHVCCVQPDPEPIPPYPPKEQDAHRQ